MFQLSMVKESKWERKRNPCLTNGSLNIFSWWVFPILQKVFWKKKNSSKNTFFSKIIRHKKKWIKKITKIHPNNCLQDERGLQVFPLLNFEYCQIWLNTLMDDQHLSNITKLEYCLVPVLYECLYTWLVPVVENWSWTQYQD